jgi:hypothetical protein
MTASESNVQSRVRLRAADFFMRLWRNNRGAFQDITGRLVRYGLANDSKELGKRLRTHDLIGWRRVTITPEMVGKVIAQFASIECKPEGWAPPRPGPTEAYEHYKGQLNWRDLVNREGGYSMFVTDPSQLT